MEFDNMRDDTDQLTKEIEELKNNVHRSFEAIGETCWSIGTSGTFGTCNFDFNSSTSSTNFPERYIFPEDHVDTPPDKSAGFILIGQTWIPKPLFNERKRQQRRVANVRIDIPGQIFSTKQNGVCNRKNLSDSRSKG